MKKKKYIKVRKKIIDTLYETWSERGFKNTKTDIPDGKEAIKKIAEYFDASEKDTLFVESTINAALSAQEEAAFKDGFNLCHILEGKN